MGERETGELGSDGNIGLSTGPDIGHWTLNTEFWTLT